MSENRIENVLIIGSGPAGDTAALYASRAELNPLVVEGITPGGQLTITTDVENYPGFPEGIMGPELMVKFREQAERFGARYVTGNVTGVDFSARPFSIEVDEEDSYYAKTVIITSGATAMFLGIPGESELMGRGVSACATCDGFFFRNKELVVVGGGDTAMEESTFLTKFASKVHVVHRRDQLRASKVMQERAFNNPKIDFIWDTVVEEIQGVEEGEVKGVRLRNVKSNEVIESPIDGVFMAIGHKPNTGALCRTAGDKRGRLHRHARWNQDQRAWGICRRRRAGLGLPAGRHRCRHGLHGRHRRGAFPDVPGRGVGQPTRMACPAPLRSRPSIGSG